MKLNISYPATGSQKMIEVEDEAKLRAFYDKRISHEVEGEHLGDDFKGYIFRIAGGNDKQGFPMLQGVLTSSRGRRLFTDGMRCFRPRKRGERKRKSVRGCIVSSDLSVLHLVIVKKGAQDIPGLTDEVKPRRLGPKRATRIRKLFNLEKKDDVRQHVIRRPIVKEGKKPTTKAPKIQRLVTPQRLQRKRHQISVKKLRYVKSKKEAEEYNDILAKRLKEQREKRKAVVAKKRSISRALSGKDDDKDKPTDKKDKPTDKKDKPTDKEKDKQPKDKQPKDKQPKDKQPKDKQPKDKQPKDKQPKDKQPKDKQPKDRKPSGPPKSADPPKAVDKAAHPAVGAGKIPAVVKPIVPEKSAAKPSEGDAAKKSKKKKKKKGGKKDGE